MDKQNDIVKIYRQNLEEDIIASVAKLKKISIDKAMKIYYESKLSGQIFDGKYGIDNLDPKYLAQDLIENEPELFSI